MKLNLLFIILLLIPAFAVAHNPSINTHENPAVAAAHEMAHAAENLWAALTPEQQKKISFDFKDTHRYDWHFIPRDRQGLSWKEMTASQQALAHALLASGLSQQGYIKAETIRSLESVLHEIEQGKGMFVRDAEMYFFTLYGKPGEREPWGWRVEGHHLSFNFTIVDGKGAVGGPTFMGANPAEVRTGSRQGLRALAQEEDLARSLVRSLNDDQQKKAIVSTEAPADILSMNVRKANPLKPAGILAVDLNSEQKALLTKLITLYAERLRPELSTQDLAKIFKAGFDKVGFAWLGSIERGKPHYYRVQGPTFLLEYDNTQDDANHIHSVWRDYEDDFGEDLIRKHYEESPHHNID